jgi:hypothetical protein
MPWSARCDSGDRNAPDGWLGKPARKKIDNLPIIVFFIANGVRLSSIPAMTKRLILTVATVVLAVALNSCCCLF